MATTKNIKETKRDTLIEHISLPKNTRAIVLAFIENKELLEFLKTACESLNISLVTNFSPSDSVYLEGADAFIADSFMSKIPVQNLLKNQVVPILPLEEKTKKDFTEFNPMKFEGNAFLFEEKSSFHVLEKLIRYLENIRYFGDKRTLLQNVEKTILSK